MFGVLGMRMVQVQIGTESFRLLFFPEDATALHLGLSASISSS